MQLGSNRSMLQQIWIYIEGGGLVVSTLRFVTFGAEILVWEPARTLPCLSSMNWKRSVTLPLQLRCHTHPILSHWSVLLRISKCNGNLRWRARELPWLSTAWTWLGGSWNWTNLRFMPEASYSTLQPRSCDPGWKPSLEEASCIAWHAPWCSTSIMFKTCLLCILTMCLQRVLLQGSARRHRSAWPLQRRWSCMSSTMR